MAIEKTYLLGKNITLGCGFDLQAKAPLDSRQVVPEYDGLQALIDGNAAYEGMIVYDEGTKKTYQAQIVDGVLAFREFGINEAELKALIASETTAAMEFKGAATALPENPTKGDFYKVTTSFDVAEDETAKIGDSIVYDGEQWFIIPSGDDIEDTWRPVTGVDNDSTLTFEAGDRLEKTVATDGTITYKHVAVDAPTATPVGEDEQTRTYITSVETDGHGHITGYKTATENVVDTNTEYTFEGQSDEATSVYFQVTSNEEDASAEVVYLDAYSKNEIDTKLAAAKTEASNQDAVVLAEAQAYADGKDAAIEAAQKAADDITDYVGTFTHATAKTVVEYINAKTDGIATSGNLEALAGRVTAAEGEIDALQKDTHTHANKDLLDTYTQTEENLADAVAKKHSHSFADTDVEEAIAKKHSHTFVEAELNKIADGDVAKWNAAEQNAKDYTDDEIEKLALGTMSKEAASDYVKKSEAVGYDDILTKTAAQSAYQPKGEYYTKTEADAAFTDSTEVDNQIDAKINALKLGETYQAKGDYAAGKHTHVASEITDLDDTIKGYDYATKTELGNVDAKFANYKTAADQKAIDDEQDRRLGVIEGDYLKAADIADFETKENVKKVADDLAAYVTSNDAALAAETKARTDADAGFETRIAALEGNFGDGEGTVEAQIAAAVAAEAEIARAAEKANADDIDALEGRMDTAEGKITALETESVKHAIKTEVDGALALKADKSVVEAMYTNDAIDTAVQGAKDYAKGLVDAIPEQTDYTVTITSNTDDATVAKTYVFSQCGAEIGSIKLAKELVVTAGSVKVVETADAPYAGAKVGEKYIELVIANQETPIYVPAKDLVDIYTAKDGAAEVQVAISNTNEISATLVNGGITEEKLAAGVKTKLNKTWEEVGVAKGLVDALADGQVKTNKEAIEAINNESTGILKQAKDYADGLADNYAEAEHDHVVADITDFESAVATKVESYGYATTTYADQAETDAKAYADTEIAKDRARLVILEAINHDAYIAADTALHTTISKEIDDDVKAAIDAEVLRADNKYEEKGVAQTIVNNLKLSETYEPIGAESRAIAAAKTETEKQVKALADNVYTKTETYTKTEVDALLTWGSF